MIARWSEWKSFPDAYHGEYIQAPIGPGVYEVCQTETRERVAFGCSHNVAETLTGVLRPGRLERGWFFRRARRRYATGEVSLADLAEEYSVGRSTIHRVIHRNPS